MAMSMKFSRAAAARPVRAQAVKPQAMKIAQAAGLSLASFAVALSASAATINLGTAKGALVFDPASVDVAAGEEITFVNVAGFPHNIVFDEDAVPAGVNADAISKDEYLNAPGETYTLKLTAPGVYEYKCEPHEGAGMKGVINVK